MPGDSSERAVGLVIMAKRPRAGAVKTRLAAELGDDGAAALYRAMLEDRCAQVRAVRGALPAIAFAGDGDDVAAAAGLEQVPQPPGGIGAGLAAAADWFLHRGIPVALVDSDSPDLPIDYLQRAVDWLREPAADIVLGPADDGGYYLIGLARPAPELFRDMPWSTAAITGATLARAAELGLSVRTLPLWADVDTPADLDRLRERLHHAWWPERTAAWLQARRFPRTAAPAGGADLWQRPWQPLSSRPVYATPWLRLREDVVLSPAGARTTYSVIEAGECVGVLPFVDDDTVLLVRQNRYIAGRVTWEMPTGGVHAGESPEAAARRELAEEAQVAAGRLEPLASYHTSKSVMAETAHLYLARELTPSPARSDDEHEFIQPEAVPFTRVLHWVRSGEIVDSMTIIAVLHAALARTAG